MTTYCKNYRRSDSGYEENRTLKYCCYQRTKKLETCDGQTVYVASKVDRAVTGVLHQLFVKIRSVPMEKAIKAKQDVQNKQFVSKQKHLKTELTKERSALSALENEIIKAVQGQSSFDAATLNKLISERKTKISLLEAELQEVSLAMESKDDVIRGLSDEYVKISNWATVFDESSMPAKKMIAAYLINKVTISRGYEIEVELNLSLEQFNFGLGSTKVALVVNQ